MAKIVGIRFKRTGKIYYFSPGDISINEGDHVIVETARGIEYGTVVIPEREEKNIVQPLKNVLRLATEEDTLHEADNKKKEMEAFVICLDKIKKHGLEMKLIDCEITFDNSKILFYFTAEGRIDFRDLVKELASIFHTRIELRQEGVRDETKTLGGLGCCGRELCCHSYLTDFVPVSIKMAKNQNLSLNNTKISGVCGRLMCCLKYEENVYEELIKKLPSSGDEVITPDGMRGTVSSVATLSQKVKVLVDISDDEKEIREYNASELEYGRRKDRHRQDDGIQKHGHRDDTKEARRDNSWDDDMDEAVDEELNIETSEETSYEDVFSDEGGQEGNVAVNGKNRTRRQRVESVNETVDGEGNKAEKRRPKRSRRVKRHD